MTLYMGIDPGLDGALVVIDHRSRLIGCHDIPTVREGTRRQVHSILLARIIRGYTEEVGSENLFCTLERQHAHPRQGVSSVFKLGRSFGQLEGMLSALAIPHSLVSPRTWTKLLRDVGGTEKKARSVLSASRRWPDLELKLKKHHNRAEAALLAEFGRMNHEQSGGV